MSLRSGLHRVARAGALLVALGAAAGAHAQGRLEARYVATLTGIPIGRGAWIIEIGADQYRAAASGATSGLLRMFASGEGTGATQGLIAGGRFMPQSYSASITTDKKTDQVRLALSGGNIKEMAVDPPQSPDPERVPITEANLRGVIDPMTGSIVRVGGSGDPVNGEACLRNIAVFDGRIRYDLHLAFKRIERVKAKGYEGPAVVCAVYFSPIAGHIPSRRAIKYLAALKDMEVWLAPIANTRVLAPFRFQVPTPVGEGVLQATEFVSAPQPSRAAAAGPKAE